jgi:hypothetical protein
MIKTSKLQLNQPDATAAHPDRNHAEIIADAQHAAGLDAGGLDAGSNAEHVQRLKFDALLAKAFGV